MQDNATPDNSPAADLVSFEVGEVYYANLREGKAFITVTSRDGNKITAQVDSPNAQGSETQTIGVHHHSNANGVMVECITVEDRLSWADLDASTVFGEEWVACYLDR